MILGKNFKRKKKKNGKGEVTSDRGTEFVKNKV